MREIVINYNNDYNSISDNDIRTKILNFSLTSNLSGE